MSTVRRYPSPILAEAAAAYLRQSGIVATVVGGADALGGISVGMLVPGGSTVPGAGPYAVVIHNGAERDRARQLLAEMEREPVVPDEGWEAGALPDLSLLDPSLAPPCPACGAALPLDAAAESCPSCGAEADVCGLLAARHGAELLAACCPVPEEATDIPGDVLDAADLLCPACSYPLRGLPRGGRCPECGGWYDKRTLLGAP